MNFPKQFLLQKSFHYINLLKDAIRLSMTSLKAADAKEVASSITALANEKLKAEKEANTGKKKTGKYLHLCPSNFFLSKLFQCFNRPMSVMFVYVNCFIFSCSCGKLLQL